MSTDDQRSVNALRLTTDIVAAYLSNNALDADKIPDLVRSVHATIGALGGDAAAPAPAGKPAVPIDQSITKDYIICLEDGKKLKMLKRYLRSHFQMTPEEYRRKWGLPADYPMVAPSYAKRRSQFAKDIGLGRKTTKRAAKKTKRAKRAKK